MQVKTLVLLNLSKDLGNVCVFGLSWDAASVLDSGRQMLFVSDVPVPPPALGVSPAVVDSPTHAAQELPQCASVPLCISTSELSLKLAEKSLSSEQVRPVFSLSPAVSQTTPNLRGSKQRLSFICSWLARFSSTRPGMSKDVPWLGRFSVPVPSPRG